MERKDLADLIHSFTVDRPAFINRLRFMSSLPHRLLVISAALSQVKSPYAHSNIRPNRILQSLIAVLVGLNVPFPCTETHELGEEVVGCYLYQIHLYDWLETNWVVYAKPPFGGPHHVLGYLARYTHRVAITNHRLVAFEHA